MTEMGLEMWPLSLSLVMMCPLALWLGGDCEDLDPTIYPGSRLGIEAPNTGAVTDYNCDNQIACLDVGCNSIPDLLTVPLTGDSELIQEDGSVVTLSGLSNIRLAAKVPLQDDRYARVLTLQGEPCVSTWLTITMDVGAPEVSSLSVSSVQGQKVLFDDVDNDGVSDIIVIAGYGADNGMNCPTEPNIQYFKMQLQNSSYGPDLWRVHQTADFVGIQGVDAQVVDIDANGNLDLVLCSYQNDSVQLETSSILYDAFAGSSGQSLELDVEGCRSIEVLDWDDDGALDVVMAGDEGQHIFRGADDYEPTELSDEASQRILLKDIDGNGQDELIFVPLDNLSDTLLMYWNGDSAQGILGRKLCQSKSRVADSDLYPLFDLSKSNGNTLQYCGALLRGGR